MGKLIDLNLLSIFKKNCDGENQDKYQDKLTFDDVPTVGSDNPVKSGGIKGAISNVESHISREVANAIDDLTLYSDVENIQSASGLSMSEAAEALGVSEDNFNMLFYGNYFRFAHGVGYDNKFMVTKINLVEESTGTRLTCVLGNNDIVIDYISDMKSGADYYNITVNS